MVTLALFTSLFLISLAALVRRFYVLSHVVFINKQIVRSALQRFASHHEEIQNSKRHNPPEVIGIDDRFYLISTSAKWEAVGGSKLRAIYLLIDEKPRHEDLVSAVYDPGNGVLFFIDSRGQYVCFPWNFSVYSTPILWLETRIIYLVYFDEMTGEHTEYPCPIKVIPHLLVMYRLERQAD